MMRFYRERIKEVAPASTFTIEGKPVEYGYIRKIERVTLVNKTGDRGSISIYITGHGYKHYVDTTTNLTSKPLMPSEVPYHLRPEEGLGFDISGVNTGDEIEVHITGIERLYDSLKD